MRVEKRASSEGVRVGWSANREEVCVEKERAEKECE